MIYGSLCSGVEAASLAFQPMGWKAAEGCPDTPRYKAIGNSVVLSVMKFIGERINNEKF